MTRFVRVKNKQTGHEFDLPVQSFDPDKYSRVDKKRYPESSRSRRPKPHVLKRRIQSPVNQPEQPEQGHNPEGGAL